MIDTLFYGCVRGPSTTHYDEPKGAPRSPPASPWLPASCGPHQPLVPSVMIRTCKPGNYLKIDGVSVFILLGWRFVFGINMTWERRDPFLFNVITTRGINKAAPQLCEIE